MARYKTHDGIYILGTNTTGLGAVEANLDSHTRYLIDILLAADHVVLSADSDQSGNVVGQSGTAHTLLAIGAAESDIGPAVKSSNGASTTSIAATARIIRVSAAVYYASSKVSHRAVAPPKSCPHHATTAHWKGRSRVDSTTTCTSTWHVNCWDACAKDCCTF